MSEADKQQLRTWARYHAAVGMTQAVQVLELLQLLEAAEARIEALQDKVSHLKEKHNEANHH